MEDLVQPSKERSLNNHGQIGWDVGAMLFMEIAQSPCHPFFADSLILCLEISTFESRALERRLGRVQIERIEPK
jgi:hypothetical protein